MKNKFMLRNFFLVPVSLFVLGCSSTPYRESTGQYIDSSTLTAKVKSALWADKSVSGWSINVVTFKDVVELNGFVNTYGEKVRATKIVRKVPGVKVVINNLVVKTTVDNTNN